MSSLNILRRNAWLGFVAGVAGASLSGVCMWKKILPGLCPYILVISLTVLIIFMAILVVQKESFDNSGVGVSPYGIVHMRDKALANGREMNSNIVPKSEVEHRKGLVDWAPTFQGQQEGMFEQADFLRRKKNLKQAFEIGQVDRAIKTSRGGVRGDKK